MKRKWDADQYPLRRQVRRIVRRLGGGVPFFGWVLVVVRILPGLEPPTEKGVSNIDTPQPPCRVRPARPLLSGRLGFLELGYPSVFRVPVSAFTFLCRP
jgi:hypothetical protein